MTTGLGNLAVTETTMSSTLLKNVLKMHMRPSVKQLKLTKIGSCNSTTILSTPANPYLNVL